MICFDVIFYALSESMMVLCRCFPDSYVYRFARGCMLLGIFLDSGAELYLYQSECNDIGIDYKFINCYYLS